MNKLPLHTPDLTNQNYTKLAELFPNAVTETIDENGNLVRTIDADILKQEINTHVVSGKEERYQFTWPDKKKAIQLANSPIAATLRPCPEESVNFDNTENLYIEGDNLDVLKLLRETYLNRVKMIYIDPPYNTGNDFVYEDDFAEDADEFRIRDKQYDEDGNRLVRNLDSNGRFHTDWLNMMYPRLKVARDLLCEDGVIFISIDDNEVHNLRKICDEIFGNENFVAKILRKNKAGSAHDSNYLAVEYEYCIVYSKNIFLLQLNKEIVDTEKDDKYRFEDNFIKKRGKYYLRDLDYKGSYSKSLDYPITMPNSSIVWPGGQQGPPNTWRWSKEKFEWGKQNEFIVFKNDKVYIKQYQFVDNNDELRVRTLPYRAYSEFLNSEATQEVKTLVGDTFSYPKPVSFFIFL